VRDRDRWWWAELMFGLVFCAGGVVVPYFLIKTTPTPAENQFVTDDEYRQWIGMAIFFGVVLLGGGAFFIVLAARARRRHRIRLAALQGDVGAMPLAAIGVHSAAAPDVAEQPLELMWRTGIVIRVFYVPILGLQALAALISVGATVVGQVAPIFMPPPPYLVNATPPMSVMEIVLRIAGACVVVALVVGFGILFVRAIPHLFGRPFGLSATNLGIDARTEWGSRVHMAWDEIRLLEVAKGDTQSKRRFDLYASGKRIGWTEYMLGLGAQYVPVGVTTSEMTLRQAALLNLVVARTGLAPRTLAKTLARRPTPARAAKRSSSAITLLVLALIVAGIAAAIFFVPVMPVSWVNWVSVGSLAISALILIVVSLWTAVNRSVLPAHARPPSVGAPSLDASGVAYVLSWRPPLLRRLTLIALGLCLGINLVPCAWVFSQMVGLYLPGSHPQFISDTPATFIVRVFLTLSLTLVGVIGLGLALGGVIARTGRIRADKDGLTTGSGRFQRLMAWSSVQEISWQPGGKGQFTYAVKSDAQTTQISWPAGPEATSAIPPSDGAVPIGADELAALVAARIGKPIQVLEG
jgi:hypothetical protein